MTTKVQKWGNSLAVRIPSSIAEQLDLSQGSEVELSVENQSITVKPKKKKPTLEELVAQITPKNKHEEVDLGEKERNCFKCLVPDRGDLVYLDFNPQLEHEQAGTRPGIVLSPKLFNQVCPITRQQKGYPFEIALPSGLAIEGVILTECSSI